VPDEGPEIVIHAALLETLQAAPEGLAEIATFPFPPEAGTFTDDGLNEYTAVAAACVTVTFAPAMVIEAVRTDVVGFAATE